MKRLYLLTLVLLVYSCKPDPETYIEHINGYWEIDRVTLANGETKTYKVNLTADYFVVSDSLTGYRKKVQPQLDGSFKVDKTTESFKLEIKNDSLFIIYSTPFNNWKETILNCDETQLKIMNQNKDVYLYKRFTPLNLE